MLSAKRFLAISLIVLITAVLATALVAFGFEQFRFIVYFSVLAGVIAIAVSLLALLAGKLKNDLYK